MSIGQYFHDTQDRVSYTSPHKKKVAIKSKSNKADDWYG
jgi:hypothetical protein